MAHDVLTPDFSDEPDWRRAAPPRDLPLRELPREADVAIVGSGYTGLSAALTLARGGRQVHVFETEHAGYGASTRNSGYVGFQLRNKLMP